MAEGGSGDRRDPHKLSSLAGSRRRSRRRPEVFQDKVLIDTLGDELTTTSTGWVQRLGDLLGSRQGRQQRALRQRPHSIQGCERAWWLKRIDAGLGCLLPTTHLGLESASDDVG